MTREQELKLLNEINEKAMMLSFVDVIREVFGSYVHEEHFRYWGSYKSRYLEGYSPNKIKRLMFWWKEND